MELPDWLLQDIIIRREFYNGYYVAIFFVMLIAIRVATHYDFTRFSLFLWLSSGLIGLCWEVILFALGMRHYNPGFIPQLEILYHALSEAGPGLIIMIVAAHVWGIVDLSHLKDRPPKPRRKDGARKKGGGGGDV